MRSSSVTLASRARRVCSLGAVIAGGLSACADEAVEAPFTDRVEIALAPLTLAGLGDVCIDIEVRNGPGHTGDVVWSAGTPGLNGGTPDDDALCSDQYGDPNGGGLAYVGPCDASGNEDADPERERTNSVTLWFDALYDTSGAYIDPAGPQGWQNPCATPNGCTIDVLCEANADARARFDLTWPWANAQHRG